MIIEYHIPRLGKLTAELYEAANRAYSLLDKGKHIGRMKQNPQLGVIRHVYEGAHHTRWEYVVTQLYLINKLKEFSGSGLSNSSNINGTRMSGAELLQIWVLLLNTGHLYGTFSNERGILKALKQFKNFRTAFRSGLPRDHDIRQFFNEIIETENSYRVHEIIAFFFLERLRRKNSVDVDLLIQALKLFKFDPTSGTERRRKLKNYFRKIRQVSFLFLDSHYGPVPLVFELGPALFNFNEHSRELFLSDDTPIMKALDSFAHLLSENLYLAPQSMYAYGYQGKYVFEKLQARLKKVSSVRKIDQILTNQKTLEIKYKHKSHSNLLRFWIDERNSSMSFTQAVKTMELEDEWNTRLPKSRCHVTVESDPAKKMLGITLAFSENLNARDWPRLLSQIMQRFISFQDDFIKRGRFRRTSPTRLLEPSCKELLLFILKKLMGQNLQFIPNPHSVYRDMWAIQRGSTNSAQTLNKLHDDFESDGMHEDRLQEIKLLSKALGAISHRGTVLMTTSQIIVRRTTDGSDITDLDGIAICSDSAELSLVLVEAKNVRRGGESAARSGLARTLTEMGYSNGAVPQITSIPRLGAFCRVDLFRV